MSFLVRKASVLARRLSMCARSLTWKRDDSVVLFGGWFGKRYADTSRCLFEYLSKNKGRLGLSQVVWVTTEPTIRDEVLAMGYTSFLTNSAESKELHKTAGWHIVCNAPCARDGRDGDILGSYSFRAHRVNLWHGVMALKGVGFADGDHRHMRDCHPVFSRLREVLTEHSRLFRLLNNDDGGWGDCKYLSTTCEGTRVMRKFFMLPEDNFIETGNPRVLFSPTLTPEEKEVIATISSYRYVILYLPTFRDPSSTFDPNMVHEVLEYSLPEDAIWIQKLHSASAMHNEISGGQRLLSLSPSFDVNVLMPYAGLLITDYSTAAGDAMYYGKPVVYYVPDYDEYATEDRGFVVDFDENRCGPRADTERELKRLLSQWFSDTNSFVDQQRYEELRKIHWGEVNDMNQVWSDIKNSFI